MLQILNDAERKSLVSARFFFGPFAMQYARGPVVTLDSHLSVSFGRRECTRAMSTAIAALKTSHAEPSPPLIGSLGHHQRKADPPNSVPATRAPSSSSYRLMNLYLYLHISPCICHCLSSALFSPCALESRRSHILAGRDALLRGRMCPQ